MQDRSLRCYVGHRAETSGDGVRTEWSRLSAIAVQSDWCCSRVLPLSGRQYCLVAAKRHYPSSTGYRALDQSNRSTPIALTGQQLVVDSVTIQVRKKPKNNIVQQGNRPLQREKSKKENIPKHRVGGTVDNESVLRSAGILLSGF
ncbi:hypothetical protein PoB_005811700 [Plakobranchus ocellatus]|uniref:Uncharacterized protein n=1 Tax=Plakobranchus ocellatus TaxID=259542 RepID=A0AAV4CJC4_9GAST|nr:hypothetical protein PoB_005811700 [Plakobranchus ocellatus]